MNTIGTAVMKLDRVTKGAVLYKVAPADEVKRQALTSIYLRKVGLSEPFPATITITVTVEDGE